MEQKHALGRRKSAVARVYVAAGTGKFEINGRPMEEYFKEGTLQYIANQALEVTGTAGQFDVKVTLVGGGTKGQAEAVRLGIARALCEVDKEAYRSTLKAAATALPSRPPVSSPATPAKLSVRNLVSLAHVVASSSVSVNLTGGFTSARLRYTNPEIPVRMRIFPSYKKDCRAAKKSRRPAQGCYFGLMNELLKRTNNPCQELIFRNCLMQAPTSATSLASGTPRWLRISS